MASSDVSAVTSFFSQANEGFTTTTSNPINAGASTVPLNSTAGLTNGTVFVGIIEPGVTGNQQTFTGIVDTNGLQITGVQWVRGSNIGHTGGVTVVDYVSGAAHNMTTKGILVAHEQTGVHKSGASYPLATIADFTNSNHTHANAAGGGQLAFAALLSTIFSSQVTTYSNPGSAGGTFYYINLGGIKFFWGITSAQTISGTGAQQGSAVGITFPVGFFTTIQHIMTSIGTSPTGTSALTATLQAQSTTVSISVILNQITGSNGSAGISAFVIGT